MDNFVKRPDKYKRILKKEEKILWSEYVPPSSSFKPLRKVLAVIAFVVFAITLLGIFLDGNHTEVEHIILLILSVFSFLFLIFYKKGATQYLATNRRIIIDTNLKSNFEVKSVYYRNIFDISDKSPMTTGAVHLVEVPARVLHQTDEQQVAYQRIKTQGDRKELMTKLKGIWLPNSPYQKFNRTLESVAQKHGLDFSPMTVEQPFVGIKGECHGMPVRLVLSGLYDVRRLLIEIECPNEMAHFFSIKQESMGTAIDKITGSKEWKLGEHQFDRKFFLQSNNESFIQEILRGKTFQRSVINAAKYIRWEVKFGTFKKAPPKRKKSKDSVHVLDAHLLGEVPVKPTRIAGEKALLELKSHSFYEKTINFDYLAKETARCLEMTLVLAQRLKALNH